MSSKYHLLLVLVISLRTIDPIASVDEYSREDFTSGFIFGSGTSAYQVEGAADEDGRSPSIWDTYVHAGYAHGANGDIAADQYHKYKDDVKLMAETGLDAYRFSISWSRLLPNGRRPVNPKGLQYYNNLINELIKHGIQPYATLHHFDLPQALEDEYKGWLNRKIVRDFTSYADVCFREFGDRVLYWTTLNEVNAFSLGGYDQGMVQPGRCSSPFGIINCTSGNSSTEPYIAAHNMLLAHASAAAMYKAKYKIKQKGFIGITIFTYGFVPLTKSEEDIEATQRANEFFIGWIFHPLVFGDYPDTMKRIVGSRLPVFTSRESKLIHGAFNFLGLTNYQTVYVKDNSIALEQEQRDFIADMAAEWSFPGNALLYEYPIAPWGLEAVLAYIKKNYGNPPIYIQENGQVTRQKSPLEDISRVKYLHSYIAAVLNAVRKGSDIRGYFQWSFLDVFEVFGGYDVGFGLYYVDLDDPDLKRYPKLSASWYSSLLNGSVVSWDRTMELERNLSGFSSVLISDDHPYRAKAK